MFKICLTCLSAKKNFAHPSKMVFIQLTNVGKHSLMYNANTVFPFSLWSVLFHLMNLKICLSLRIESWKIWYLTRHDSLKKVKHFLRENLKDNYKKKDSCKVYHTVDLRKALNKDVVTARAPWIQPSLKERKKPNKIVSYLKFASPHVHCFWKLKVGKKELKIPAELTYTISW